MLEKPYTHQEAYEAGKWSYPLFLAVSLISNHFNRWGESALRLRFSFRYSAAGKCRSACQSYSTHLSCSLGFVGSKERSFGSPETQSGVTPVPHFFSDIANIFPPNFVICIQPKSPLPQISSIPGTSAHRLACRSLGFPSIPLSIRVQGLDKENCPRQSWNSFIGQ